MPQDPQGRVKEREGCKGLGLQTEVGEASEMGESLAQSTTVQLEHVPGDSWSARKEGSHVHFCNKEFDNQHIYYCRVTITGLSIVSVAFF